MKLLEGKNIKKLKIVKTKTFKHRMALSKWKQNSVFYTGMIGGGRMSPPNQKNPPKFLHLNFFALNCASSTPVKSTSPPPLEAWSLHKTLEKFNTKTT